MSHSLNSFGNYPFLLQSGFTVELAKLLGISSLYRHHCLAHRLQLILKNAAIEKNALGNYKYLNLGMFLTKDFNSMASFHRASAKNMAHLRQFMAAIPSIRRPVKPQRINDVRWVPSHQRVCVKTYKYGHIWSGHLGEISDPGSGFSSEQRTKADENDNFFHDMHAIMSMVIQLDIFSLFQGISEEFQKRGASIIGYASKKAYLLGGLIKIFNGEGVWSKEFLSEATCPTEVDPMSTTPCTSLSNFENSPEVEWRGLTLMPNIKTHEVKENGVEVTKIVDGEPVTTTEDNIWVTKNYDPVSSFLSQYIDSIREKIDKYFPDDELMEVSEVLNQREWPYRVEQVLDSEKIMNGLKKWPKVFGLESEIPDITEDIKKLVEVLQDGEKIKWCNRRQSSPTDFWNLLLSKGVLTPNLKKLVQKTITFPYGSAEAERMFSLMNLILSKSRSSMDPKTLDILMRIRCHEDSVKTLDVNRFTFKYLLTHLSCKFKLGRTASLPTLNVRKEGDEDVLMGDYEDMINADYEVMIQDAEMHNVEDSSSSSSSDESESSASSSGSSSDSSDSESDDGPTSLIIHDDEPEFELNNAWEGTDLTAVSDRVIRVQEGTVGEITRKWFLSSPHGYLVAHNGKVLQANGPKEPVTLEYANPTEPRQQWNMRGPGLLNTYEITTNDGMYYLELLGKPRESDVVRVGVVLANQRREGSQQGTSLWMINSLDDPNEP